MCQKYTCNTSLKHACGQLSVLGRGEVVSCAQGAWRASLMDEVGE